MEKQNVRRIEKQEEFSKICHAIKANEKGAQERLIAYFEEDIRRLSHYIRLPEEESIQALQTDLLEYVICKIKSTDLDSNTKKTNL